MADDARFIRADRFQARWDFIDLEALLPSDHRARIVMGFVESLDLRPLYDAIKAREGEPGRPPPILRSCWGCGFTRRSKGSARRGSWSGSRDAISRIGGSPAGCR
jgi:hypothetical protein